VASNPNRLQVQQLCAGLIGNTTSTFGAPGSPEANSYLFGQAAFTGINGDQRGNANVKPENADTYTFGVVFNHPGGLEGLAASVDFYSIKIQDAIATFNGQQIYQKCFNSNGQSNPGYSVSDPGGFCALINRNASTGGAGTVIEKYLNAGIIDTAGVDLAVNWTKSFSSGGAFYMNHLVSYLDKFNTQTTPTDPVIKYAGTLGSAPYTGTFDYKLNSTFGYRFSGGAASAGVRWRYLPEVKNGAYISNPLTANLPTNAYSEFDAFGSYNFGKYQLRGGIDNLLDTAPAVVGATRASATTIADSNSASTLPGFYDVLGRRFYVGLNVKF
jgi:outer membrane receptor protein involved in Fe transport